MLTSDQINEIHRLHLIEKWSLRRIARHLHIGRHTLAKYVATPAPAAASRERTSKLDPYKPAIAELLQQDSSAAAPVIAQRLQTLGYTGGITILKDYLCTVRKNAAMRRAYVRMEPGPGERFDIDWGHFGVLLYNGTPRRLYAFCLVECHSRKMYLEFTHSQRLESRNHNAIERRFRLARLQSRHSIDSFNFKHHKSRMEIKARVTRLLDLEFLDKGTSVIFIGNPGVGKTLLAKIIGWRACQANKRVLFTTAADMLNYLNASQIDHSLIRKLKLYTEPTLLVIDELGYLTLDQQTSNLFYQVVSTRHSHKRSTMITTNTAFSDWGNILHNTTIATAIADRLVENSEIFLLGGDSVRKLKHSPPPAE